MDPFLQIDNLSKRFGALLVLQQINFELYPGEIIGLAGRSGAGKSVLVDTLAGLYAPSQGHIIIEGERIRSPFDMLSLGVRVIHQEPRLAENLDITENIFLGQEIGWSLGGFLRIPFQRQMDQVAADTLAHLGKRFPSLREKVANVSSEERQLISIARAMVHPAKLIIVDEPTGLLSYAYQQTLLTQIQDWQQQGMAVLFSSNNLDHLMAVTDRIITLQRGLQVAIHRTDEVSREQIVAELVGATGHDQLTPAIWALDNYYRAREQAERLRHQQLLLEKNLYEQDTLNQQLVEQLAEQVEALDGANFALQAAQRRLLTEREEERKRLSRELHDQVIQDLLSLNYELEEMGSNGQTMPENEVILTNVRHDIRLLVEDVRRICGNLRPPTIDSLGLGAALQSYTRDWAGRVGIEVNLTLALHSGRLPEAIELSIFRIVQESLSNVRKHAQASQVEIQLRHTSPRMVMLTVADNGKGLAEKFDLSILSSQGHYGLLGISERVALSGGQLRIQNHAEGGVLLHVEIPHPRVKPPHTELHSSRKA